LVYESEAHLRAALASVLPGWDIIIRSYGGVAQCDYHAQMVDDADHRNVRATILAFSGNLFTPCVVSRPYPDSYYQDAHWAANLYGSRGIPVAFVAAPGRAGTTPDDRIVPNVYRYVGIERGIRVVESDDLFVDPATGKYESTGPCLVGECADRIIIRSPDGGHFCPLPGSIPCAVYSSGIVRYDDGIVRMAAVLAGIAPPPGRVLVTPTSTTTTSTTTTSTTTTTTSTTTSSAVTGSATGDAPSPGSVLAPGVVYPTARPAAPYSPLGDLAPGR